MKKDLRSQLKQMLIDHEGLKHFPYVDSVGKLTIGIGHNLTDRGLPIDIIHQLCDMDLDYHWLSLHQYPWFKELSEPRQLVLMNLRFNLGERRFATFKKMLAALERHDYFIAAHEMLDSNWAKQVGMRAKMLASIMRCGEL